jgi:hypothetical protein
MKREYLGDSYDAVKRLWCNLFSEWAPLYANPDFIPDDENLRQDFTRLTGIPMLPEHPPNSFSILNDPDVGIRLPGEKNQREGRTHITVESIVKQLENSGARCVITFDQSYYHKRKPSKEGQRRKKMRRLRALECDGFYYVSHASFLFAVSNLQTLQRLRRTLVKAGIPEKSRVNRAGIE